MKFVKFAALALGMFLMTEGAASAQGAGTVTIPSFGPIGAGLVLIGAGLGIGRLAGSSVESMARQPEMAGNILSAMLIAAALIEGAAFFALILVYLGK
jgi:F-type H+-transporting ATPase subunit c